MWNFPRLRQLAIAATDLNPKLVFASALDRVNAGQAIAAGTGCGAHRHHVVDFVFKANLSSLS